MPEVCLYVTDRHASFAPSGRARLAETMKDKMLALAVRFARLTDTAVQTSAPGDLL